MDSIHTKWKKRGRKFKNCYDFNSDNNYTLENYFIYNICILQQGAHVLSSQKYHQPCSDVGFSTILLFNMVTNMTDNLTETNDILTDLYDEPIYVTLPRSMLRGNHRSS
jgi:hypothetical protein